MKDYGDKGTSLATQPAQQEPFGKVIASVSHLRSISVEVLPEATVPPVDSMLYTSPQAQPAQQDSTCNKKLREKNA